MNASTQPLLRPWQTAVLGAAVLVGIGAFAYGVGASPERGWRSLLVSNFYFLSVALTALVFVVMHQLASAGWHVVFRRVPEAMTGYLPAGAVLMLATLLGVHSLYHWTHVDPGDTVLQAKTPWLNVAFFAARTVAYLALWIWLARRLRALWAPPAPAAEGTPVAPAQAPGLRLPGIFAVVFALTFSLASIDWIMSLEPHWYSTLFPWYVFSSALVGGVTWIVILVVWLKWSGRLPEVGEAHLHDLGKYVFAFSLFWAYLWLSQFLLIWYANIPEESAYYALRSHGGWWTLFLINIGVNTALPLLALLPAAMKRHSVVLFCASIVLALGHWLDMYLLIMPSGMPEGPLFGLTEVGVFLGVAAIFLLSFERVLRRAPIVPRHDPYLVESLHHHA